MKRGTGERICERLVLTSGPQSPVPRLGAVAMGLRTFRFPRAMRPLWPGILGM